MQNAVLLSEKVEDRLGKAERQQEQNLSAAETHGAKLAGTKVHQQESDQKTVAQQRKNVRLIQTDPGGEEADAPASMTKDVGKARLRGFRQLIHSVSFSVYSPYSQPT